MRHYFLLSLALTFSLFLILTCVKSPTDPYTPEKAAVDLILRPS